MAMVTRIKGGTHRFAMLHKGIEIRGMGRILKQKISLQLFDLGQQIFPHKTHLLQSHHVLQVRDHVVHRPGDVKSPKHKAEGKHDQADDYFSLHGKPRMQN